MGGLDGHYRREASGTGPGTMSGPAGVAKPSATRTPHPAGKPVRHRITGRRSSSVRSTTVRLHSGTEVPGLGQSRPRRMSATSSGTVEATNVVQYRPQVIALMGWVLRLFGVAGRAPDLPRRVQEPVHHADWRGGGLHRSGDSERTAITQQALVRKARPDTHDDSRADEGPDTLPHSPAPHL